MCAAHGHTAQGEIVVKNQGNYTFGMIDSLGQKNDSLPSFRIGILTDEPPAVQFLKPAFNKNLTPQLSETLLVEAVDDFGIRLCRFHCFKDPDRGDTPGLWDLSDQGSPRLIRKELFWDLKKLNFYPGDTVFYWAQVRDTKPLSDCRRSQQPILSGSGSLHLRRLMLLWQRRDTAANSEISDVKSNQEELSGKKLEQLLKSSSGNKELSWEQRKILDDIKQDMQAQSDSLKQAVNALKENIEKMKQGGLANPQILDKMEQVRKSLEELIKQYGDSVLFDK